MTLFTMSGLLSLASLSNAAGQNRQETAMRYLCLVYANEARLAELSRGELDTLIDETLAANEELEASGHLLLAQALEQVDAATTVRVRDGRLSATDGPFAETREQLGGFVLIEARDLNEAIRIAGRLPSARLGSIEVRPAIDLLRERSPR
jgi:hypothetical protein